MDRITTLPMSNGALHRQICLLETRKISQISILKKKKKLQMRNRGKVGIRAGSRDPGFGTGDPGMVDAHMSILRRRMDELRFQEENCIPPEEWTDWEKRLYPVYHSKICEVVGLLQNYLMHSRPITAIACLSMISLVIVAIVSFVLISSGISVIGFGAQLLHSLKP